jgi:type II secretory pathway pseudopilin PulG
MKLRFQSKRADAAGIGRSFPSSSSSSSSAFPMFSRTRTSRNWSRESAFTMVEIAISLAIIAFALVAIIGVLPLGLDVQKENRQETIINQDAGYWMDAIRNGARGLDDLTNYVMGITNYWTLIDTNPTPWDTRPGIDRYDPASSQITSIPGPPWFPLTNGYRIVGLLSTPRMEYIGGRKYQYQSNYVVAFVRALSGSATEKFPQRDQSIQSLAFSYRMIPEIDALPLPTPDVRRIQGDLNAPEVFTNSPYARNLLANLHDVRLLFRWPLLPNLSAGNGRQSYRSLIGGNLLKTNDPTDLRAKDQPLHFFQPTTFVNAP